MPRKPNVLVAEFGKVGRYYYAIARGQYERLVNPNRIRKSIGAERSFYPDLSEVNEMASALKQLAQQVEKRLHSANKTGCTVTLKVKYDDYQQVTRAKTDSKPVNSATEINDVAKALFWDTLEGDRNLPLLWITISGLRGKDDPIAEQLEL